MAYNGSVELISGITQANNGTFPLVDASAVRVDDETRLDEALENVAGIGMRVTNIERRSVLSELGQTIKAIVFTVKTSVDYSTQTEGGGKRGHNLIYIPIEDGSSKTLSWSDPTYTTTRYRIEIGEKLYPLNIDGKSSQDTSSFTYYKGVFLLYYKGDGTFDMSTAGGDMDSSIMTVEKLDYSSSDNCIYIQVHTKDDFATSLGSATNMKGHNFLRNELLRAKLFNPAASDLPFKIKIGDQLYPLSINGNSTFSGIAFQLGRGQFIIYWDQTKFALDTNGYEATQTNQGFMSAADKTKLDGIDMSTKQDVLTFDSAPTANSTNPVTSGGVYTALQNVEVDLTDYVQFTDLATTSSPGVMSAEDKAKMTFVTPEMFGAVGDGTTDDTTALQNCISYARTNSLPVKGYKRYKTSSTIAIAGTYQDIEIERITYTGNEYAVSITGSYHTIRINTLYCASGSSMVLTRTGNQAVQWNKIYGMRYYSYGDGVSFSSIGSGGGIYYNTLDIRIVKSDTGDCFHLVPLSESIGENIFMNTTCTCPSGWAINTLHGRFYNFTFEGDVLNGILNGAGFFSGFRVRELVDKRVRQVIDQTDPSVVGGVLVKFTGSQERLFVFNCDDAIPYEAVDVSEMTTAEEMAEETPFPLNDSVKFKWLKIINAPIRVGQWDTKNGAFFPGKQMIIVGGRKICIPAYETVWTITEADYDMRDEESAANNAKIYPTKMIIGVDDCVVHLPPSYCAYGYSEFVVDQSRGHLCTIYDSNSDATPIFDGETLGAGVYKLKAYCDAVNSITATVGGRAQYFNDSKNYVWDIEKIGGGLSSDTVYVKDFGAVGDGETDDSEAIQAAVNAGYRVCFESNKTYYVPTTVTIDHDIRLYGGENTKIITKTPTGGALNTIFAGQGTLKKTTTMTTDYTSKGSTDNSGNKFTLDDMDGISIGDVMVITATDQYYDYSRAYYYLGGTLMVGDIYDGHIYTTISMPFDIELTENVTVKVYDAPTIIIEDLNFEADMDSHGNYRYFISLGQCKNSIIRNCNFTKMDSGIVILNCVNTLIDGIEMSKSEEEEVVGDGYSVYIGSSTGTIVQRMLAICSQAGISLSGTIPNINTYIRNCELASECRRHGVAMHENSYNSVIEDCTLGGLSIVGVGIVNRCRFIKSNRSNGSGGISYVGSHNPDYAILKVKDCIFEDANGIYVTNSSPQNPIQASDNIIGLIEVTGCTGGQFTYMSVASEYTLSNVIKRLNLIGWKDCYEVYRPNVTDVIEKMFVSDCTFSKNYWMNDHNPEHGVTIENVYDLDYRSVFPMQHKIAVDKDTYGERYTLPENVSIALSSDSQDAAFIVCGNNLASDNLEDYAVGNVTGEEGGTLTRTPSTGSSVPTITKDTNGNFVYTQKNNTSQYYMYPLGMFYAKEYGSVGLSATIKSESSVEFRACIAIVDCSTGKLVSRYTGTRTTATSGGATISYSHSIRENQIALCYYFCSGPVANAETTFENMSVTLGNAFVPSSAETIEPYVAKRIIGDGTIMSLAGVNNIMSSELNFHVSFGADFIENPIGLLPSGTGVSF